MSHHLHIYHALDVPQAAQYYLKKVVTSKPVKPPKPIDKSSNLPSPHLSKDDDDFLDDFKEKVECKIIQNNEPFDDIFGGHQDVSLLNNKSLGSHECPTCSEIFVLKFSLLKHLKCHGRNLLFKCQVKRCD